jgi:sortase (surface protein transpeptidase)
MRAKRGRHAAPARIVRRPWAVAALLTGIVLLFAGAAGLAWARQTGRPAAAVGKTPLVRAPRGPWAAAPQVATPQASSASVALPVSLTIPAIGVSTSLVQLGLTTAGTLQVPSSTAVAGWYTGSPRPGQTGAAVIAGHVDSQAGPAVFFRLRLLQPGQLVYVRRADGSLAVFQVNSVQTYLKTQFPTAAVYNPQPNAQLRLITCGGTFDYATGHYLSNVVVSATLDGGGPNNGPAVSGAGSAAHTHWDADTG